MIRILNIIETHQVKGRGTIYVVPPARYAVGETVLANGQRMTVRGVEMSDRPGHPVGLILSPVPKAEDE